MKRYGVTWYGDTASIAQTGYEFSRRRARRIARAGAEAPDLWAWAAAQPFAVDAMTNPSASPVVRADVETATETGEILGAWVAR